jgi:hypothetical protein
VADTTVLRNTEVKERVDVRTDNAATAERRLRLPPCRDQREVQLGLPVDQAGDPAKPPPVGELG